LNWRRRCFLWEQTNKGVVELEKKDGIFLLFFWHNSFAANCKKSRMNVVPNSKRQKKRVWIWVSPKWVLLSFSLTSLNKAAKSALCFAAYPPKAAALGCGLSILYRLFSLL
jgi:hypothetical protein